MPEIRVLVVCMGNICRSPLAEGVLRHLMKEAGFSEEVLVDSAGTHAYHVGEPPDVRVQAIARQRGIDLSGLRARQVTEADFAQFDYLLAMDRDNLTALRALCPAPQWQSRIQLFLDFAPHVSEREVPDPYYGGADGFKHALLLIEEASRGFVRHLGKRLLKSPSSR